MRGGRSLLVLLVAALGLGAYIYFVEAKKDLTDPTTKKAKVFSADTSKIETIEVRSASGDTTTIKKVGTDWKITAPLALDADATTVGSLVSSLESLETQKVLDEKPASVKDFGLEPARFTVGFQLAGEATMHRLNIGIKTPTGGDLYARVDGDPRLLLISSYVEDSLNRTTFDLRDKTVLKFERDGVDGLTLEHAGTPTLTFARKGNEWRFSTPLDARADFSAVDGIVGRVAQVQMKSVATQDGTADLKKYGLDKPQLVAVVGAGSTRATLALGGKADDATIYARDLARPVIFTVEKTLLDDLNKKADDLRMKDVFEFRSFSVVGIDLTYGGTSWTFAKSAAAPAEASSAAETWKQTKPEAKDVNQTAMADVLNTVSSLRADKFTDKALASGDDLIVVARIGNASAPTEERVTLRKSGDVVHAIRTGEPGAAIVPTADFDKAIAQIKALSGSKPEGK